jgi:MerR family transcriptional regulator, light-induced transcriptional regulator
MTAVMIFISFLLCIDYVQTYTAWLGRLSSVCCEGLANSRQSLYDARVTAEGYIRIGELSRRVGVSPELLRAWERRYGLLDPDRSPGRFRLYSDEDVARVRAMKEHLSRGLSAAEAARVARETPVAAPTDDAVAASDAVLESTVAELRRALDAFDEPAGHAVVDRALAAFGLETVLRDIVLPTLNDVGARWERGEVTVAQEHFASNLLRGRLLGLARGWGQGTGPVALLAAPPGEQHDLGLVVFGLALRARGWRVTFLGADTPIATVADTAERISPEVVVLAALMPSRFGSVADELAPLAAAIRVLLAGTGATPEIAERVGAEYSGEDPIGAAEQLTAARVA